MSLLKKCLAEVIGTFVLTLVGCGVAVVAFSQTDSASYAGILICVSLAFGLSIVAMAYSIGNVSGCHINPAVSLAFFIKDRKAFTWKDLLAYWCAQIIGAILASFVLWLIFINSGIANLSYGANTVNEAVLGSGVGGLFLGLLVEVVLTFIFVIAILGVTSKKEYQSVSGIVIGLTLTLVHLLGIGLTGTSVNTARSIGPAIYALFNGVVEPIQQIWIFIIGPLAGATLAAVVYKALAKQKAAPQVDA